MGFTQWKIVITQNYGAITVKATRSSKQWFGRLRAKGIKSMPMGGERIDNG